MKYMQKIKKSSTQQFIC